MAAKVNANTAEKLAAAAMLTLKSAATCGSRGSKGRTERLAGNVSIKMMLYEGGIRSCGRGTVCGISASRHFQRAGILGDCVERHQRAQQALEVAQGHHVGPFGR